MPSRHYYAPIDPGYGALGAGIGQGLQGGADRYAQQRQNAIANALAQEELEARRQYQQGTLSNQRYSTDVRKLLGTKDLSLRDRLGTAQIGLGKDELQERIRSNKASEGLKSTELEYRKPTFDAQAARDRAAAAAGTGAGTGGGLTPATARARAERQAQAAIFDAIMNDGGMDMNAYGAADSPELYVQRYIEQNDMLGDNPYGFTPIALADRFVNYYDPRDFAVMTEQDVAAGLAEEIAKTWSSKLRSMEDWEEFYNSEEGQRYIRGLVTQLTHGENLGGEINMVSLKPWIEAYLGLREPPGANPPTGPFLDEPTWYHGARVGPSPIEQAAAPATSRGNVGLRVQDVY